MAARVLNAVPDTNELVCLCFSRALEPERDEARSAKSQLGNGAAVREGAGQEQAAGSGSSGQGRKREREEESEGSGAGEPPAAAPPVPKKPANLLTVVLPKDWLSNFSPLWAAQMEGHWAEHAARDASTGWPVLLVPCTTDEEVEAAPLLLHFLKTNSLQEEQQGGSPKPLSVSQLCMVYRLAQQCDVPRCREACIAAITALTPEQLSAPDICTLLEQLQDASPQEQEQLKQLCSQRLVQLFGDVDLLLNSTALRQSFQSLSLAAVLLWAQSDQLQVVESENDVVVALTAWEDVQPKGTLSPEQLRQLSARVRVQHLTLSFRLMLTRHRWFDPHENGLMGLYGFLDSKRPDLWRSLDMVKEMGVPPAWVAAPRVCLPAAEVERRRTLELTLSRQQLEEAFAQALGGQVWQVDSPTRYSYGQALHLQVRLARDQGKVRAGLYLKRPVSLPSPPVYLASEFGYLRELEQEEGWPARPALAEWESHAATECLLYQQVDWGYHNLFLGATFSSVEELAAQRYLVDGALRLRCRLLAME